MALLQQERDWFSINYEEDGGLCEVEVVGVSELQPSQTRTTTGSPSLCLSVDLWSVG